MFREMRRKDRLLTAPEAEKIIKENTYGILSTICKEGYPYGVPLNYAYGDGKFYFHHTNEVSLLGENIKLGCKACFTIIGKTEVLPAQFTTNYESVIAFGTIKALSPEEKVSALMKLVEKYSPQHMEVGKKYAHGSVDKVDIYQFTIEHVSGKSRK